MSEKDRLFSFDGKNKQGLSQKGEIKAISLRQAKNLLERQGLSNLKVQEKKFGGKSTSKKNKKVKVKDIVNFTRQMATMSAAGIPLVQSFDVLIESSEHPGLKKLINDLKTDVESGSSFSQALKQKPQYFDILFCNLIEAGEQSGKLDTMLARLATYKEKIETLKSKVKKAMMYPIGVLTIAIAVTIVLLVKVIPTFKSLFEGFGANLPEFTLFVLKLSDIVRENALTLFVFCVVFFYLFRYFYKNFKNLRDACDRALLKLPIFGSLFKKVITARFARTLATTFAAGVPLADALDSIAKISGNVVYFDAITEIKNNVTVGQQMKIAMRNTGAFDPMVTQMIGIGEESGKLEPMLIKVADIYDEEVDNMVDGLTTLLEPMIIVFLGVIVGGLVVAMYLPIFKMGSVI